MAERDRAAVHVGLLAVETEVLLHCQVLRSERFVDLDEIHVLHLEAGTLERLARRRSRTDPHDVRVDAADAARDDPRDRTEPGVLRGIGRSDDHRRGAVVDARGVAGGDRAVLLESRDKFLEYFRSRIGADVLVLVDDDLALLRLHRDRDDLLAEAARLTRLRGE